MSTEYQQRSTGLACNHVYYAPLMCWNQTAVGPCITSWSSLPSSVSFRTATVPLAGLHTTVKGRSSSGGHQSMRSFNRKWFLSPACQQLKCGEMQTRFLTTSSSTTDCTGMGVLELPRDADCSQSRWHNVKSCSLCSFDNCWSGAM